MSSQTAGESQTVGIVGLGLIGGSIGLALRNTKRTVIGCDLSSEAEATALERFCLDRVVPFEEVCRADFVFIGVPPESVRQTAEKVFELKAGESVVTDCSSVKAEISEWAQKEKLTQFVPGHPMAGHEKSGSRYASSWLFKGAKWLLTPTRSTSPSSTRSIKKLVEEMGATPVVLNAEEHDRHIALLSHLPHVLAGSLILEAEDLPHRDVSAGSWRDLTRVGGVDPGLWSQILYGNRTELINVIQEFSQMLTEVKGLLQSENSTPLAEWLSKAKLAKERQSPPPPDSSKRPGRNNKR